MHLAALVDLGVPQDWLRQVLSKLPVQAEFDLAIQDAVKMGISGTQARVTTVDSAPHRHHSTIGVERRALAIFQMIAEAEGKIHNVPPEKVHFHEVGAVDSIVDIVAAAACIEYFNPDVILCNPIEVGSGFVDCAHGRFPVPAPATSSSYCGVGTRSNVAVTVCAWLIVTWHVPVPLHPPPLQSRYNRREVKLARLSLLLLPFHQQVP